MSMLESLKDCLEVPPPSLTSWREQPASSFLSPWEGLSFLCG